MNEINFKSAQFLTSSPDLKRCPAESGAEIAFAGRSNAGKSSAINALTQNKKLARTSKTPGRTQLINYFQLESHPEFKLVDLPGYGYAKVPLKLKRRWQDDLSEYLQNRQSLRGLVVVMDVRHPLQEFDTMMINWAMEAEMPVHLLLTKADKLKQGPAKSTLLKVQKHMHDAGLDDLISAQLFSSSKNLGIDPLNKVLRAWLSEPPRKQEDRSLAGDN